MKRRKSVALLIETSNAYARGLLGGIQAFIREHRPWSVYLDEQSRGDEPPHWLTKWKGDGIIARIENPAIARVISTLAIPAVDLRPPDADNLLKPPAPPASTSPPAPASKQP